MTVIKRPEQIIALVNDVLEAIEQDKRGRASAPHRGRSPTYPTANMLLIFLLKSLKNWSINHPYNKLTDANDVYADAGTYPEASFQADANRRHAAVSDQDLQQMTTEIAEMLAMHPWR